ncbi:chaperonin family protein RbcX [Laspinema sp. D1]|uniref:RuBisCO chaperone RbcX n=1 Tax=Laspinema palackyanum D2a TaxID=2953684 RepID=A0ABT2MZG4_9CYAN|nr:chaperonin family protein RbcX [Laspinema sp. D2a]
MDLKQIAKDTAKVMSSYLTYQAMRIVVSQLNETNPPLAYWLQNFSATAKIQDGEAYIQALLHEKPDLAIRIMTVREHIAEEVTEFLPEMVLTGIMQANIDHRKQYLERTVTGLPLPDSTPETETEPGSG